MGTGQRFGAQVWKLAGQLVLGLSLAKAVIQHCLRKGVGSVLDPSAEIGPCRQLGRGSVREPLPPTFLHGGGPVRAELLIDRHDLIKVRSAHGPSVIRRFMSTYAATIRLAKAAESRSMPGLILTCRMRLPSPSSRPLGSSSSAPRKKPTLTCARYTPT